jgi:hypothetical protein
MLNKKGMSPLLLTIILIAFAVALGAMIMSWGSNKVYAQESSCENVELVVQQAFNNDLICFNEETGKLKIVVKNSGKQGIDSIIYRKISPDLTTRDITLPSSAVGPGRIYDAEVPFQQADKIHIELIPQLNISSVATLCDNKAIVREKVPVCKLA